MLTHLALHLAHTPVDVWWRTIVRPLDIWWPR